MFYVKDDKQNKQMLVTNKVVNELYYASDDFNDAFDEARKYQTLMNLRYGKNYSIKVKIENNNI